MHKINLGNIKEWAANYTGPQFDGILCDPPYELGFMGKSWDSSGIAFDTEMWADLFRHIKPGGHLLAFSGSRTYHRMAVAIEDAGFEIRDMIEWVYGSGFPKSLNIGKATTKMIEDQLKKQGVENIEWK
jgi:DNA modification methylase